MEGTAEIFVDAPPDRVWRLLADVERMGQWSPITYKCRWVDGASGPEVGSRFKGYNWMFPVRWATTCEITESDPGKVFAFKTIDGTFSMGARGKEMTRWRYTFEPEGIGTKVTESYDVSFIPPVLRWMETATRVLPGGSAMMDRRRRRTDDSLTKTLERLKAAAEEA